MLARKLMKSGPGGPWTPAQLTSLAGWYDFSAVTTMFTDDGTTTVSTDGQAIYRINDKGPLGLHLRNATLAERPLYKVNLLNGLSLGQFDTTDQLSNAGDTGIGSLGCTLLSVSNVSGTTKVPFGTGTGGVNGKIRGLYTYPSGSGLWYPATWAYDMPTAQTVLGSPDIVGATFNGAGSNVASLLKSGVQYNGTLAGGNAQSVVGGVAIGGVYGQTDYRPSQTVAEVIICSSVLSTNDIQKAEGYLAHKWGLTARLPVNHPYKTVAP